MSQKFENSRQGNLRSRFVALGSAHVFTLIGGLVSAVLWTRFMPKELFGEYKVVLSVLSFIGAFCYLGIGQAALMSAARGFDGNLLPLIRIKLWANVLGTVGILLAGSYYALMRTQPSNVATALVVAALLFPAYNMADTWTSWLNGKSRFRELSIGRIGISILSPLSLLCVIATSMNNLWIIVAITFAATGALNMLMLRVASKHRATQVVDQSTISYSHHATVAMSFGALLALDAVILEHFHGPAEVAVYAVALLLPDQLRAGFGLINQALAPTVYSTTSLRRLLGELRPIFLKLSVASASIAILGFFVFPFAITLLFSEKYAAAAEIGKWLWLFSAMTAPINTFLGGIASSRLHAGRTYVGNIGYSVVLISFCLAFLDKGAAGFVWARIATYLVTSSFHVGTIWWLLRRESSIAAEHRR